MNLFPAMLKLQGRACLVVGAGRVGESKIAGLLAAGASLRVVAPRATPTVAAWARAGRFVWHARAFRPADLDGVFLVVAATAQTRLNERIYRAARRRGVLANAVDDPSRCDFYYPAVVRRGDLLIAISTAGQTPALAQRLRREFEKQFGPEYEAWVEDLGRVRTNLFRRRMDSERRRRLLHRLASHERFERFVRRSKRSASSIEVA